MDTLGNLAQLPHEVRQNIYSFLDSPSRAALAQTSKEFDSEHEVGNNSTFGLHHATHDFVHLAETENDSQRVALLHDVIIKNLPANEPQQSERAQRFLKGAQLLSEAKIRHSNFQHRFAWLNLPSIAHTLFESSFYSSLKESATQKGFVTSLNHHTAAEQLHAARKSPENNRAFRYFILSYNCPQEHWDDLRKAAIELPEGAGLDALDKLEQALPALRESMSRTQRERIRDQHALLRVNIRSASLAKPNGAGALWLHRLALSESNHSLRNELAQEARQAALLQQHGQGAQILYEVSELLHSPQIRKEAYQEAKKALRGEGYPVLELLFKTIPMLQNDVHAERNRFIKDLISSAKDREKGSGFDQLLSLVKSLSAQRRISREIKKTAREALLQMALAMPDGLGSHKIEKMMHLSNEHLENTEREMALNSMIQAARDLPLKERADKFLKIANLPYTSQIQHIALNAEASKIALTLPDGEGAPTLLTLLGAALPQDFQTLHEATHGQALAMKDGGGAWVLLALSRGKIAPSISANLRHEALTEAVKSSSTQALDILEQLDHSSIDQQETQNVRKAMNAIAQSNKESEGLHALWYLARKSYGHYDVPTKERQQLCYEIVLRAQELPKTESLIQLKKVRHTVLKDHLDLDNAIMNHIDRAIARVTSEHPDQQLKRSATFSERNDFILHNALTQFEQAQSRLSAETNA